jgi:hypothetical protein
MEQKTGVGSKDATFQMGAYQCGESSLLSEAGTAPGNSLMAHSACLVSPGSDEHGE